MSDEDSATLTHVTRNDSEHTTDSLTSPTVHQAMNIHRVQNVLLIWLHDSIDEQNEECRKMITQLRAVVNDINMFKDSDQCVQFTKAIADCQVCMIISDSFGQHTVPHIHNMSQVDSIFILCDLKTQDHQWIKEWSKIKGLFSEISLICAALKQTVQLCEQNSVPTSFLAISAIGELSKSIDRLDSAFMYTKILKEALLTINFEERHIKEFLDYCRGVFVDNDHALNNITKLEQTYRENTPIWWYTGENFLYSMLNQAIRSMNIDLIIRMGFFIGDLHRQIQQLHSKQSTDNQFGESLQIYRGQGLSIADFEQMKKTKDGFITFNSFLSTTKSRPVAIRFALQAARNLDLVGVLFNMNITLSQSTTSFASTTDTSYLHEADGILFSMHTIFRICDIKPTGENNRLYEVNLTLTPDNDENLDLLNNSIKQAISPNLLGWYKLGEVLLKMRQFIKAQEVYQSLLPETTDENGKASIYHQLGFVKDEQGAYEEAIKFYQKAIEIKEKILPPDPLSLANSYACIGHVFYHMSDYLKGFSFLDKAVKIRLQLLPSNHPDLTYSYNIIGLIYHNMGDYSKALSYIEKTLEIQQQSLSPDHPDLACTYSNLGEVYRKLGERSKSLSFHEKALEIRRQTLAPTHPDLSISYNNVGMVYYNVGDYTKALLFFEKALHTQRQSLPENHLNLAFSYNNMGATHWGLGDYSNALSSYEKALEIRQQSLPANHLDLCASYNNVGMVYYNIGDYQNALVSYEKALAIRQQLLLANHLDLASSYNNIGFACCSIGDYSKALICHKKALEIRQQSLSPSHPDFAASFNNIGIVYYNMGDYSKAFPCCQRAVDIADRTLPLDHPDLQMYRQNLQYVKEQL